MRWGYPVLVACSLIMGLSLWLHYSVSDAADSYDVVAKKILQTSRNAQNQFKKTHSRYATTPSELRDALLRQHRGPYLIFMNPGCGESLETTMIEGPTPTSAYAKDALEVAKSHFDQLRSSMSEMKNCDPNTNFTFVVAAFERKKSQWDIWTTDESGKNKHLHFAKLPATRAHRIKQIAIVLLVLGDLGVVSLLIPRFLDRFYIRREDPVAALPDSPANDD